MDPLPRPTIAEVEAAAQHRANLESIAHVGELVVALWAATRGLPRRVRLAMCMTLGVHLVSTWAAGERRGGDDL